MSSTSFQFRIALFQRSRDVRHPMSNIVHWINAQESLKELEEIRTSVNKARPYGADDWAEKTVKQFNLGATLRNPSRPRGGDKK